MTKRVSIVCLHECFILNEDGTLVWKCRPREHFKNAQAWAMFNTRYSGKPAGWLGNRGYVHVAVGDQRMLAHHVIFAMSTGAWPLNEIDHIDGRRTNNKLSNLREATRADNNQNQTLARHNTSGLCGVSFNHRNHKWRAYIVVRRRQFSLGHFETKELAGAAYLTAKKKFHQFNPVPRHML